MRWDGDGRSVWQEMRTVGVGQCGDDDDDDGGQYFHSNSSLMIDDDGL